MATGMRVAEAGEVAPITRASEGKQFRLGEWVGSMVTPEEVAARWRWHAESVRRVLREGRMRSVVVGRRRLIATSEVERVEKEGLAARTV